MVKQFLRNMKATVVGVGEGPSMPYATHPQYTRDMEFPSSLAVRAETAFPLPEVVQPSDLTLFDHAGSLTPRVQPGPTLDQRFARFAEMLGHRDVARLASAAGSVALLR